MFNFLLFQKLRQQFRALNTRGADQYRRPLFSGLLYLFNNGFILLTLRQINRIIQVLTQHRLIGWNNHNIQAINLPKLKRFGIRCASHAGELIVETEIVLKGGGRQRLILIADRNLLFCFNRLMNTI